MTVTVHGARPSWQLGLSTRALALRGGLWQYQPEHPMTPAAYLGWVRRLTLQGLHFATLRHFAAPLEVALPPLAAQARQQNLFLQLTADPSAGLPLDAVVAQAASQRFSLVVCSLSDWAAVPDGDSAVIPTELEAALDAAVRGPTYVALCHEPALPAARLAGLLQQWDRPRLGAFYDPVTALTAGEAPAEAARVLAPHMLSALARDVLAERPDPGDGAGEPTWRLHHTQPGAGSLALFEALDFLATAANRLRTVVVGSPVEVVDLNAAGREDLEETPAAAGNARSLLRAEEEALGEAVRLLQDRYAPRQDGGGEEQHGAGQLPIIGRNLLLTHDDRTGDERLGDETK